MNFYREDEKKENLISYKFEEAHFMLLQAGWIAYVMQ